MHIYTYLWLHLHVACVCVCVVLVLVLVLGRAYQLQFAVVLLWAKFSTVKKILENKQTNAEKEMRKRKTQKRSTKKGNGVNLRLSVISVAS